MSDKPVEQTPLNETTLAEHITDNMSEDKLRSIVRDNLREGYANQGKFFQHDWDENFGPKEMDEDDSGLDEDRFLDLMCRIKSSLTDPDAQPDILDFEWETVDDEHSREK